MVRRGKLLSAAAFVLVATPAVAAGNLPCAQTRDVVGALRSNFGELPISSGLQQNGQLLQIFASPQSGTWTAVTTSPDGVSCILATGQRWSDPLRIDRLTAPEG